MLALVGAVVAVLAIHLILTDVDAVDELDRLVRGVALVDTHTHQTLISDHHEVGDHEDTEDADKRAVFPSPSLKADEVRGVLIGGNLL